MPRDRYGLQRACGLDFFMEKLLSSFPKAWLMVMFRVVCPDEADEAEFGLITRRLQVQILLP